MEVVITLAVLYVLFGTLILLFFAGAKKGSERFDIEERNPYDLRTRTNGK